MGKRASTRDESTEEYVACMGESLGKYYSALDVELMLLYVKWNEYLELFDNNQSRIDLLNKTASGFFSIVQQVLWDDLVLHVARLLEDPKNRGNTKTRLTLKGLMDRIDDSEVQKHVGGLINVAEKSAKFCIDWRHRRLAHRDLNLAMKKAKPLKTASLEKMKTALNSIKAVLNAVRDHYYHGNMHYEATKAHDGAYALLSFLHLGKQKDKERRDRFDPGECRPEDWAKSDL